MALIYIFDMIFSANEFDAIKKLSVIKLSAQQVVPIL